MPAQKKTSLGLNQWIGSEYPKRIDFVENNKIIDDELSKRVKYTDVATDTTAGIVALNTISDKIKLEAPKPDLTPYIPFSKGYRNSSNNDFVIRCNNTDCWAPRHLYMYLENGDYMGCFHVNGGRAYYKVPNRNGGNWCEIMDNHDMAIRDNRMNEIDADKGRLWGRANDAWNRTQNLYDLRGQDSNDRWVVNVRDLRYVGAGTHTYAGGGNNAVVTAITGGGGGQAVKLYLQYYRNGGWITVGTQ